MTTKQGSSFQCKTSERAAPENDGISIDIVSSSNAMSLQFPLNEFLDFADFVENTRARLLREEN
jgi:hypothetical protein